MIARRENQAFGGRSYEPTPGEIRRACDEIQATWSPRQRVKRNRVPRVVSWMLPIIPLSDIVEAMNAERADRPRVER